MRREPSWSVMRSDAVTCNAATGVQAVTFLERRCRGTGRPLAPADRDLACGVFVAVSASVRELSSLTSTVNLRRPRLARSRRTSHSLGAVPAGVGRRSPNPMACLWMFLDLSAASDAVRAHKFLPAACFCLLRCLLRLEKCPLSAGINVVLPAESLGVGAQTIVGDESPPGAYRFAWLAGSGQRTTI